MRAWHESVPADGAAVLEFSAAELAQPDLGHIVENRELALAGFGAFEAAGGQLLAASLEHVEAQSGLVRVSTSAGVVDAKLVVGADGGDSPLRTLLGIGTDGGDYGQDAIVATVRTARPHAHTAWQRFLAGGPVALLPLFDGSCSIVWSLPRAAAAQLVECPPDEFSRQLDAATDRVLGATTLASERVRLPLRRSVARQMVAARAVLLGDAAHVIHPLAGQGVNLGYLDAAALCAVLAAGAAEREDPGAARLLRRYEQSRLTANVATALAMSGFNELLSRRGARGWVAARVLGVAGASAMLRRGFARHALGLAGEVPPLARAVAPGPGAHTEAA
jgi:2-octaprenylphenol hydroxylase